MHYLGASAADYDSDGFADGPDICVMDCNPAQRNPDGDGKGDACDADDDGDDTWDADEDRAG